MGARRWKTYSKSQKAWRIVGYVLGGIVGVAVLVFVLYFAFVALLILLGLWIMGAAVAGAGHGARWS